MRQAYRSLASRAEVGVTANVVQHCTLRFSEVAVDSAALILLREGVKTLKLGSRQWTARSGDVLVVSGGQTLDIRNQLSPQGLYEARWIVWDPALLAEMQPEPPRRPLSGVFHMPSASRIFTDAVDRAVRAIECQAEVSAALARHALAELLLWLHESNVTLASSQPRSMVARLRLMVSRSPSSPWSLPHAAEQLAVSQTTLRRRLSAEGATFGDVLADARMSHAMMMLQSTQRAISSIASDVGYASASRFSVRFRSRSGFAPSVVRGHQR
ncbi:AraC family transcriptional regulator [Sinimarinibacterium flocculans]|uniref:AraC family transcriptional regulator n=1 Tax=Sinimarinibacterium flocculans TaxID=985250 RepID=A0A318EIU1_9GAMM|nr:AraC family transcriptional regulator [Sinimarinibacterium flocculans]